MAIAANAGFGQRIDGEMAAGGLHALLELARAFDSVGCAVGDDIYHRNLGDAFDLVVRDFVEGGGRVFEREDALDQIRPRDRGLVDDESPGRPALQDRGPGLLKQRRKRRDRFLQLLRITEVRDELRQVGLERLFRELCVLIPRAVFRAPAELDPGGLGGVPIDRRHLRRRYHTEPCGVDCTYVRSRPAGIDPVHAVDGDAVAHKHRKPALAAVRRGVVNSSGVSPAGIEQDWVFEGLVGWVLVRCVGVIDPDLSGYLPRRFDATTIGGGAVHDLTASFDAALLSDAQWFLRRRDGHPGYEQGCG